MLFLFVTGFVLLCMVPIILGSNAKKMAVKTVFFIIQSAHLFYWFIQANNSGPFSLFEVLMFMVVLPFFVVHLIVYMVQIVKYKKAKKPLQLIEEEKK